jgi:hypothetical protein
MVKKTQLTPKPKIATIEPKGMPEEPHKDGASANPIENYLLFVILITPFPTTG